MSGLGEASAACLRSLVGWQQSSNQTFKVLLKTFEATLLPARSIFTQPSEVKLNGLHVWSSSHPWANSIKITAIIYKFL
jgi:hypothetical protein